MMLKGSVKLPSKPPALNTTGGAVFAYREKKRYNDSQCTKILHKRKTRL